MIFTPIGCPLGATIVFHPRQKTRVISDGGINSKKKKIVFHVLMIVPIQHRN